MFKNAKIKIRDIKELQEGNTTRISNDLVQCIVDLVNKTPLRKRKAPKNPAITSKIVNETDVDNKNVITEKSVTKTKPLPGTAKKFVQLEQPSTQKRIDSYFTSSQKTYQIKDETPTPIGKNAEQLLAKEGKSNPAKASTKTKTHAKRPKAGRKRLFADSTTETDTIINGLSTAQKNKKKINKKMIKLEESILISDDDEDDQKREDINKTLELQKPSSSSPKENPKSPLINSIHEPKTSVKISSLTTSGTSLCTTNSGTAKLSRRKTKPCPPYKIIEDTTFAVDAFQFGYIDNVTHYFLTHFHADHYIGLTKSFAMPIYMSPITARFLRAFIPIAEQYIHELELNQTYTINGVEVTALDANHCPGSILLVFKLPHTDKCILHTGDFRAWHGMESEPIFWNNDIHTIYLDTTYISDKYAFCSQYESLFKAYELIDKFQEKHADKRILYICGSYVIGKEKFWSKIAENYNLKVWAEGNRNKALKALNDEQINQLLVEEPNQANMHVIAMGKISYLHLLEYIKNFEHLYDLVFAIRPSGWEKDNKPQYRGVINIVGIEYSEHSSYDEMKRFVKFLKPKKVLSTVPTGRDLMKTAEVPLNWYQYDKLKSSSNYQPTIATYLTKTPQRKIIRPPNFEMDGVEHFVSPLKLTNISANSLEKDEMPSLRLTEVSEALEKQEHTLKELNTTELEKKYDNNENCSNFISKNFVNTDKLKHLIENSSEEFEKADIALTQKRPQRTKRKFQDNSTNLETRKVKKNVNNIQNTPEKIKSNKPTLRKQDPISSWSQQTKRKSLRNKKEIEVTNKVNMKNKNEHKLSEDSPVLSKLEFPQRDKIKSKKKPTKNIKLDFISEEEFETTNIANTSTLKNEVLTSEEIPVSQKYTNNQISITTSSTSSKNRNEIEFGIQLQSKRHPRKEKPSNQNVKIHPRKKSQRILLKNSMTSQKNPILKSTTTSSIISTSTEEIPASQSTNNCQQNTFRTLRSKYSNSTLKNSNAHITDKYDIKGNYNNFLNKSQQDLTALSQCLRTLKDSNQTLDTKVILKTIMENNNDLEKFNCTQLAELVTNTLNENNPHKSKDHIPSDLFSDTDDKTVSDHISINNISKISTTSLNEQKRQSLTSNDHNLPSFSKSKTSKSDLPTDLFSATDNKPIINHLPSSSLSDCKKDALKPTMHSPSSLEKSKTDLFCKTDNISGLSYTSSKGHKRTSLTSIAHKLTPLKKSKQPLDTKTLLKTIMEHNEGDLSNISCTQLAGLMVEAINEKNPDNSKDHIPVDLLSDADDDWM